MSNLDEMVINDLRLAINQLKSEIIKLSREIVELRKVVHANTDAQNS